MRSSASPRIFVLATTTLAFLCALSSSERVAAAQRAGDTPSDASPRRADVAWPDWAIKPLGAKFVVLAQHESATSKLSFGIADVRIEGSAAEAAARYADALRRHGWLVEVARLDTKETAPRPRSIRHCLVEGRRGLELLRLSLERGQTNARGSLLWARNLPGRPIGATPGPC